MSDSTTLDQIVASLTAELARTRSLADAESRIGAVAALGLITAVERALDDLVAVRMTALGDYLAGLPRISGGSPESDDHEEISAEFLRDPMSWPDDSDPIYFNPPHPFDYADPAEWPVWTDLDRWSPTFDGPTPDDVLMKDIANAWEPSDEDWADYLTHRDYPLTDSDLIAAGLAVG